MANGKKLTEEQMATAVKWVGARVKRCPACNYRVLSVIDRFHVMQAIKNDGKTIDKTRGLGLIVCTCDSCAYVLSFSSVIIGLTELAPIADPG